ncbi:MAG: hypothetical protein RL660_1548 [Bacteroidota bacterium]|jgi:hypothetical protein
MSESLQTILEIAKYTVPALVVLGAAYLIVQKFLTNDTERQRLAIFGENASKTIAMRMQAYERLSMFLERMEMRSVIGRFYDSGASAQDLQLAIIQSIRSEFEYNLSQQIYVSKEVWQTVRSAVEQEIAMVNAIGSQLPAGAPAKDLLARLTDIALGQDQETPREIALATVNNEAKLVLLKP